MKEFKLAVIAGDGIGPEISNSVIAVFKAANVKFGVVFV